MKVSLQNYNNEEVATPCGEPIKRHTVPVANEICYQVTNCAQCLQYSETISFPAFINLQCTVHQARKNTSDYSIKGTLLLQCVQASKIYASFENKYTHPTQKTN